MKNKLKILSIVILVILLIYILYVCIDCIRLRNSEIGTKPVITISEEETENRKIYNGLGYSIEYYVDMQKEEGEVDLIDIIGYGAEFRLFNKILVWAWVE